MQDETRYYRLRWFAIKQNVQEATLNETLSVALVVFIHTYSIMIARDVRIEHDIPRWHLIIHSSTRLRAFNDAEFLQICANNSLLLRSIYFYVVLYVLFIDAFIKKIYLKTYICID